MRFGIGKPEGPRSPLYRVITSRKSDDVYVFARSLGGVMKASLHQSGDYRMAVTSEFAQGEDYGKLVGREDRVMQRWRVENNVAPGLTLAYLISIPDGELYWPEAKTAKLPSARWMPVPRPEEAGNFSIFMADGLRQTTWPGKTSMGTELVGRLMLPSGRELVVTYHSEGISERARSELRRSGAAARAAAGATTMSPGRAESGELRLMVLVDHESGAAGAFDLRFDSPLLSA